MSAKDKMVERRGRTLDVGGHDQSSRVEKMGWQVDQVRGALEDMAARMPLLVEAVPRFVDAEWVLLAESHRVGEVTVMRPRALAWAVVAKGPLLLDERLVIGHWLA